uniref:Uncharacterized protein n=1 Tax=viral metagenome TaxID=1070528 RepID=A0A6C0KQH8_9ZZZZ
MSLHLPNVIVNEVVKATYLASMIIAGVDVSPLSGFGLISVAESPYNLTSPTNNFHESDSDGVGVPGSPEYVLNSGLNLFV